MAELSLRELVETLATLDARTARMERRLEEVSESLKALHSMTARAPDGRTLVNLVTTILTEVQQN